VPSSVRWNSGSRSISSASTTATSSLMRATVPVVACRAVTDPADHSAVKVTSIWPVPEHVLTVVKQVETVPVARYPVLVSFRV
jgi:hypothetical protein